MKKVIFEVIDTNLDKVYGEVVYEGRKLSFKLKPEIDTDNWNRVGFIPLRNERRSTFGEYIDYAIDSRLPLKLRDADIEDKIDYISRRGLGVASDSYTLRLK